MGPEYPMTRGFQQDKAQLFQRLDRLATAMERIATQMEANADMAQAQADNEPYDEISRAAVARVREGA